MQSRRRDHLAAVRGEQPTLGKTRLRLSGNDGFSKYADYCHAANWRPHNPLVLRGGVEVTMAKIQSTITIDIFQDENAELAALHKSVPLATRHRVARAAFVAGLKALSECPDELPALLVTLRRPRAPRSNANG